MSTEKWETVTWDWIEREIVDYVLITNRKLEIPHANCLARLLAAPPAAARGTPKHDGTQRRSSSNA